MVEIKRNIRNRLLTPEEGERYRKMREAAESEKAEIIQQFRTEGPGPWGWDDLREFINCVRALRSERERQGKTIAEIADISGLTIQELEQIELEREFNPRLPLLTRYAHALGLRLNLTLAIRVPDGLEFPIHPGTPTPSS